jgi:hypothetical protein
MQQLETFLSGLNTMGFIVAAVFFFRFWSRTRERLFAIFGLSFFLLAATHVVTHALGLPEQELFWAYVLRVIAFSLLIAAIVGKNLEQGRSDISTMPSDG